MTSRIANPEELAAKEVLIAAAIRSPAGSPMAALLGGHYESWALAFAKSALRAAGTRIELDGHLTAWPLALGPLETEARKALIVTVSRPAQLTAIRVDTAAERLDFDVDKLGGLVSYLARLQAARLVDEAVMKAAHNLLNDALAEALTDAPAPAPAPAPVSAPAPTFDSQFRHGMVVAYIMDAGMPKVSAETIANTLLSKITEPAVLELMKGYLQGGGGTLSDFLHGFTAHPDVRLPQHPAVRAGAAYLIRSILSDLIGREVIDEIEIPGKDKPEIKYIPAQPLDHLSDASLAEVAHRLLSSPTEKTNSTEVRFMKEVRRRAAGYVPGSNFTDADAVTVLMFAARGNLTPERIARYYIEDRADRASLEAAVAAGQASREVLDLVSFPSRKPPPCPKTRAKRSPPFFAIGYAGKKETWKIVSIKEIRPETYEVEIDREVTGPLRAVLYPDGTVSSGMFDLSSLPDQYNEEAHWIKCQVEAFVKARK